MKEKTFKWVTRFFITLGIVYWAILIVAATTGCATTKATGYEDIDRRLQALDIESKKYTLSLDPMDRTQYHEREEFLQIFE
jgi:hypothetical protein